MATNILMPALSPTMTEGTLARWLKKEGDEVRAGDVIAEIETDKATMEVEAVDEGILGKILVTEGTAGVKVNEPIAVMVGDGGEPAAPAAKAAAPRPAEPVTPKPSEPVAVAPATAAPAPAPQPTGERIFASPLARRMAKQAGVDLTGLHGSGPNGRIVRADGDAARQGGEAPAAAPAPQPLAAADSMPPAPPPKAPAPLVDAPHTLLPNTAMRKTIARRMVESTQAVPHFYVSIDIELDAMLKLRADLNARTAKDGPGAFKLSVNDFVIKAAAAVLRRIPKVNSSFTEDAVVLYDDIDIAVAASIPDGLITPIIRKVDQKGLAAISNEMRDLTARAKVGKLRPEEFQGGGFSISNMGMYGVSNFTAIINPPQSAILAVAAGIQRAVVKEGQLAVATMMTATLSCDHRAIDGALGAEWVAEFKRVMEDPLSLML